MTNENGVKVLTDMVADFVAHIGKKLPDDVVAKLEELGSQETAALPKALYETMTKNQKLAVELNRPSCQDTGVLQFWLKCGTNFPYINELEGLLKEAVVQATFAAPLRHNSVETFDEYNTKKNVGKGTPTVWWDIVPNSDKCEIYAYMAGGGCTLPGKAMVLMPGAGYEGITDFVLDQMTSYGLNACPPLLVGVGVGTSIETAALNSKKALMRPIGSHNENANAAKMERLLEDGINAIGLGPQGGLFGMTCNVATEFTYSYTDSPEAITSFKLGTSHYIHLQEKDGTYKIVKEWYTDPFADSFRYY